MRANYIMLGASAYSIFVYSQAYSMLIWPFVKVGNIIITQRILLNLYF